MISQGLWRGASQSLLPAPSALMGESHRGWDGHNLWMSSLLTYSLTLSWAKMSVRCSLCEYRQAQVLQANHCENILIIGYGVDPSRAVMVTVNSKIELDALGRLIPCKWSSLGPCSSGLVGAGIYCRYCHGFCSPASWLQFMGYKHLQAFLLCVQTSLSSSCPFKFTCQEILRSFYFGFLKVWYLRR